ncbi:MAG TPA: hypothetical protein VH186_11430 [Chloroflexia bacterium]|nr:hypothetical protein [Chloroflexia bacterium]
MATLVRIVPMVLRVCYIAIIVLGILLWTGNFDSLKGIHMIVGLLIVAGIWFLGILQGVRGGSIPLAAASVVLGLVLIYVGLYQESWLEDSSNHWIVQIVHFVLGLSVLGIGEAVSARAKRSFSTPKPAVR